MRESIRERQTLPRSRREDWRRVQAAGRRQHNLSDAVKNELVDQVERLQRERGLYRPVGSFESLPFSSVEP